MKTRFSTVDIKVSVNELQRYLSLRVVNVYDVDHKTYLIKLALPDRKAVLVIESGVRIHSTEFEWPKHAAPSGFAMKLRKHIRGRRLESIQQLGIDRIIDLQFGSGDAAYHVILELYDRGNIALTDYEYTILNILRPRSDESQDVKLVVRQTYPLDNAKDASQIVEEKIRGVLSSAKDGDQLKRILLPATDFGPAIIEHCLLEVGFPENIKLNKGFNINTDFDKLMDALQKASELFEQIVTGTNKGYIIQKRDVRPVTKNEGDKELLTYDEFHPYLFSQYTKKPYIELEMFDKAVDEFFSKLETQKIDMKILQQEKMAVKKLENVKKDHEKRMQELQKAQESDTVKGQFIEYNLTLVDQALTVVRSAVANQINWSEINELVKQAQGRGDPVALAIKALKLNTNHITMLLSDPYVDSDEEEEEEGRPKCILVDIDLGLSAYANSKKYFDKKKQAAKKEQKTIDASAKALKSAERKTKETLKNVATAATINKARKTYWFEKFLWFISSENFVVVGGRDQQQNEMVVKRYMRPGDIYVHADLHGASSVIIKNPSGDPVPPKTLNEAGSMAICNSAAWDAKVITSAWWVYHDQVSKTAPTGEYLTTGSFMIRGKKNYLPPSHLIYGFGLLFKLEDGSVSRHAGERKVRGIEDESSLTTVEEEDSMSGVDDSKTNEDSANEEESDKEESSDSEDEEEEEEEDDDDDDDDEEDEGKEKSPEKNGILPEPQNIKKEKLVPKKKDVTEKDEEFAFPDTSINLDFSGEKLMVRKNQTAKQNESSIDEMKQEAENKGARLSAKMRRDLKKSRKKGLPIDEFLKQKEQTVDESSRKSSEKDEEETIEDDENIPSNIPSQSSQQPLKRGKRNKLKKMKEKYKDQDEEERLLRMEILASAGPAKEEKKKKGKKEKKKPPSAEIKMKGQIPEKLKISSEKGAKEQIVGTIISGEGQLPNAKPTKTNDIKQEEESDDEKADEEDLSHQVIDAQILDSLTGCPVTEDELLYSVCMVAPYNSIVNYKYKVKLLPGSTKRGKAAKTAIANFLQDKNATSREKALIKILKDSDISRNIPGKVKLAAPKLLKNKKKK